MSKKLVSDLIVDYLERRGVTELFGLCGHTVIGMLDALSRSKKLRYIGTRHEAIASTAADGYARVTHKASVVMCHLGPGLTNVITGVANASLDSIPMVVIAGDVPSYYFGRHPHQEVQMHADGDQYKLLEPVCKRCWRVDDVEALPNILDRAFRLAESGRPGPVLVDIPMDMFSREMDEELWDRTYKDSHVTARPAIDPEAAKAIAKKLVEAKNPVLHAGGGILLAQASEELAALAEFLDIPVSRTLAGQGCMSDLHPLMIGQTGFWGLEFTHSLTTQADVILGLGTRFGEADSSSWYQGVTFDPDKTTFLQIDIDPNEIGRKDHLPADRHRPQRDRPQLPRGDRRCGRPEDRPEADSGRGQKDLPQGPQQPPAARGNCQGQGGVQEVQRGHLQRSPLPHDAPAHPAGREGRHPRGYHPLHRCGLEQERRGPGV